MLPEERRTKILEILTVEGKVTVQDLSQRLSISVDTIRRDLKELEIKNQLMRVHGGAMPRLTTHVPYQIRQTQNIIEKKAMAVHAAKLIQPNQVVFIDGGSTNLEVAKRFPSSFELTVVTNCPFVLIALGRYRNIKTIMIGGQLNTASMTVVGSKASQALQQIYADIFFLGVCNLHPDYGITAHEHDEAQVKKVMIQNSAQTVAVTSSDKLGKVAPFVINTLDSLTHLITDSSINNEQAEAYEGFGITVIR